MIAAAIEGRGPDDPAYAFAGLMVFWIAAFAFSVWQLVGTWRSAARYKKVWRAGGFGSGWGILAQIALVFGWLNVVTTALVNAVPQLAEMARVAFLGDPDIPDYSIRVMRNGTEMEIIGGIKFGLTDDVSKTLADFPAVRVVHLDSPGGRAGEAEALNRLIRQRGLITYVAANCYSACVVAFAAGSERWLSRHGHLGFHRGAMDGVPDDGTDDSQAEILLQAGFDPAFVRTAIATPNDDIWKPGRQELIAAGVITGIDDGERFAASGRGDGNSRAVIEAELAGDHPLFATIERLLPDLHRTTLARLYEGYRAGDTEGMLIRKLRADLQPVVAINRGRADDSTLFALAVMTAEQYELLAGREPALCWPFHFDWDGASRAPEHFPIRMLIRELGLFERVLATAEPRPALPAKARAQAWQRVRRQLAARLKPDALGLPKKTVLPVGHEAEYCTAVAAMLRELARVGDGDAAFALRDLMSP